MNTEPIVNPDQNKDDASPVEEQDVDSALDEALKESFPASDPIAITITKPPSPPN